MKFFSLESTSATSTLIFYIALASEHSFTSLITVIFIWINHLSITHFIVIDFLKVTYNEIINKMQENIFDFLFSAALLSTQTSVFIITY